MARRLFRIGLVLIALLCLLAFALSRSMRAPQSVGAELSPAQPGREPLGSQQAKSGAYGAPRQLAQLKSPEVTESSGIVASRLAPGVYWTHNDSGDGPFIYAFDRSGRSLGVWRVAGAVARDWEDIAAGPGPQPNRQYLYLGDIGDNDEKRSEVIVYRVPEPTISAADARPTKRRPRLTEAAEVIRLRYPDGKHDAETLLVHPVVGNLYIVTKKLMGKAGVYEATAPLGTAGTATLAHLADLDVPSIFGGFITGGDISPDGSRVALCDYLQGYEIVLADRSGTSFDTIWKQPLNRIALGKRKQGEAICYRLDGKALLATSEGLHSPLIEVVRR